MRHAAGAFLVDFEQLPEEAGDFIEERRNAGFVADVVAVCGGVEAFDCGAATVAFAVVV